jgi:hypothetical protein
MPKISLAGAIVELAGAIREHADALREARAPVKGPAKAWPTQQQEKPDLSHVSETDRAYARRLARRKGLHVRDPR